MCYTLELAAAHVQCQCCSTAVHTRSIRLTADRAGATLGAVAPAVATEPSFAPMPLESAPGPVEPAVTPDAGPAEAPGPVDSTDRGIGLATPPTETLDGGEDADSDSSASPVTPDSTIADADGALSLHSAAAAVVAAVGIALLA